MSILVIIKVPGDTAKFKEFFESNAEKVTGISQGARAVGALSHVFSVGDNMIVGVDRWTSREAFEKFFSAPEIAEVMANSGASGPPFVEFYEVLETLDSF